MMEGSYPPAAAVDTDQGPDLAPLPEPQTYPIPDKEKLNLDLKVCLVSIVLPFACSNVCSICNIRICTVYF